MKTVVTLSRLIVGSLFIVSGLVKANDPLGFSYKLEDYFAETALNMPYLDDWSLFLACLVCIGEMVLGVAVLVGGKMKLTTALLLFLTLFFGWLTAYTAACDEKDTFMSELTAEAGTEQAVNLQARADSERTVTLLEQDGNTLIFQEEKSVTCVTDCGCFGDALKGSVGRSLTPFESFIKDLILFFFVLPIAFEAWRKKAGISLNTFRQDRIFMTGGIILAFVLGRLVFGWWFPVIFTAVCFAVTLVLKKWLKTEKTREGWIAIAVILASGGFTWYAYHYLPIKDYRPYKVGQNIPQGMKLCHELDLPCPEYANLYKVKEVATGKELEMWTNDYLAPENKGKYTYVGFVEDQQKTIVQGYEAPIKDFVITTPEGENITDAVLSSPTPYFIMLSKDLADFGTFKTEEINGMPQWSFYPSEKAKIKFEKIITLANKAKAGGISFIMWAANSTDKISTFRHELQLPFQVCSGDDKTIKTIVRSNPGFILLRKGTIEGKWHYNSLPTWEELKQNFFNGTNAPSAMP